MDDEVVPTTDQDDGALPSTSTAVRGIEGLEDEDENNNIRERPHTPKQSVTDAVYVSPADLVPFPKAAPRKNTGKGRKRGTTKILTSTPVRDSIAQTLEDRKAKKQPKPKAKIAKAKLFPTKKQQEKKTQKRVRTRKTSP